MSETPLRSEYATVAFIDVVDSVRLIAAAEARGVQRIRAFLDRAAQQWIPALGGDVAERRGDGLVLKFHHPRHAVHCIAALHRAAAEGDASPGTTPPLRLRAGINSTSLLADGQALYGAGVNLAARVAALGQPGDTLLTASARDALSAALDGPLEDLGLCWLKHIDEPVRVFRHRDHANPLPADLEQAVANRMKLRPTLVVLPLTLPGTPADSRFGLGHVFASQLTQAFSHSPLLHVISALTAQVLGGRQMSPESVYQVTRADYLLMGEVESDSEGADHSRRVQVRLWLWRQGTNEPIWTDVLLGGVGDMVSPEGETLGRVIHAVSLRIVAIEQRLARAVTSMPNLASHTLYLSAVDFLHRFSVEDFKRSREMLVALSERAPHEATPLAWLARWHVFRVVQGWSDNRQRDSEEALQFSERALDRDPTSSLALTMAGSVHAGVRRDAATAQSFYDQALQHNPNDSLAWLMSSVAQGFMNAREPALSASELALGLAPVDPTRHYYDALSATAALRAGQYERCVALARRAIVANGTHGTAYRSMAIALAMLERHEEAADAVRQLSAIEPHFTVQTYLARVPNQDPMRDRFAQLLHQAGLPAG